jgi:hypothetical protein
MMPAGRQQVLRWVAIVVAAMAVGGCASRAPEAPSIPTIERFDGDFAAAQGKRRVVALVSPS